MACEKTQFQDEIKVKIISELPPCANCGGTENEVVAIALVRYDAAYCHIGSAEFTAKPTGIPPCSDEVPGEETPPEEPPPTTDPNEDNDEDEDDETDPEPEPEPTVELPDAPNPDVAPFAPNPPTALRVVNVNNQATLDAALLAALPGDWIKLDPAGTYTGMVIRKRGTITNPIVISGYNALGNAQIEGAGTGNGVDIGLSEYVQLRALTVRNFDVGVNFGVAGDVTNCVFDNLGIDTIVNAAFSIRDGSTDNHIQRCSFNGIGGKVISIGDPAVNDGCHRNKILYCAFDGSVKEAVDINVSATAIYMDGNIIDGSDIVLTGGVVSAVRSAGVDCVYKDNDVNLGAFTGSGFYDEGIRSKYNSNAVTVVAHAADHYGYKFEDTGTDANHTFECDNTGTSNKTCGPEIIIDPPDPIPTENWRQHRFMTSMSYSQGTDGSGRIGTEPLRDGVIFAYNDILFQLNKARAGNYRIAIRIHRLRQYQTQAGDPELDPSHNLYDPTAVVGGFNLRRAKAVIAGAVFHAPDVRPFVDDGTFAYHFAFDDFAPGTEKKWNGRIATGNEVDELARYQKSFTGWSTVPFCIRAPTANIIKLKTFWNHVDVAYVAVKGHQWGDNREDLKPNLLAEIARAKSMGLGFTGIGNLLNQGSGLDGWTLAESQDSHLVGMSPTDIRFLGQVVREIGDYQMLGCNFWGDINFHPTYFLRSDIQAAFFDFRDEVKNLKIGPPNWRDFE